MHKDLKHFIDHLEKQRDSICSLEPFRSDSDFLNPLLQKARREGSPLISSVSQILRTSRQAEMVLKQQSKWGILYLAHAGLLFGIFLLIHYMSARQTTDKMDLLFILLSLVPIILGYQIILQKSPRSWFWYRGLTSEAREWSESILLGGCESGDFLKEKLRETRRKELRLGVSLAEERKTFIELFAQKMEEEQIQNQQMFQDLFPMIELGSFSLSAFFLVILPLLSGGLQTF